MKLKEEEEAYYFTKEGERILAENRILLHLPQYLDRLVYLEELLQPDDSYRWKEQRDALKEILLSYGKSWDTRESERPLKAVLQVRILNLFLIISTANAPKMRLTA